MCTNGEKLPQTDQDIEILNEALNAAYRAACEELQPCDSIAKIIMNLVFLLNTVNHDTGDITRNRYANILGKAAFSVVCRGHSKKLMKFFPLVSNLEQMTMRLLIEQGLFSKALSLLQHPTSLDLETKKDSLKRTFFEACIEQGCTATADATFRRFVSERSCEPKVLKEMADELVMQYLSRGEIQKAMPLIEKYQFHLDPKKIQGEVHALIRGSHVKEALSLLSLHEKSKLLGYQKLTHFLLGLVIQKCTEQEELEAVESFIRSNCKGKAGTRLLGALANRCLEKKIDKKEKALELLMECAAAFEGDKSIVKTYIQNCTQQEDFEAIESLIRSNYKGDARTLLLLELANRCIEKKVDKKEKALELLMECSDAFGDDTRILEICEALLHLDRGDLAMTLLEENAAWMTLGEAFLGEFLLKFAKMTREMMKRDASLRDPCTEITQRLINMLGWLEAKYQITFPSKLTATLRRSMLSSDSDGNRLDSRSSSSSSLD